jgi:hypothetical protein
MSKERAEENLWDLDSAGDWRSTVVAIYEYISVLHFLAD